MRVAVVDYGSGNLASASRALVVAAERAGIGAEVAVTDDPRAVARADRIVLPGQGAFADCARGLGCVAGMREAIEDATASGAPFLGICVGMQLMAERGLEHAVTQGLGWIAGEIAPMDPPGLRLPQMGWNALDFAPEAHPLLDGVRPRRARVLRPQLRPPWREVRRGDRAYRLRRPGGRDGGAGQPGRDPVPRGERARRSASGSSPTSFAGRPDGGANPVSARRLGHRRPGG